MISFWEQQSFLKYDAMIIGSGIVGLSTAITLKERFPKQRIVILERGILPTGASTKNAGFACIGSLTEILADLQQLSEQEAMQLVAMRLAGLRKLRNRLGDQQIDYRELGSYELIRSQELHLLEELERINQLLQPIVGGKAFSLDRAKIQQFGLNTGIIKHLIVNHYEGQLDTGKMMFHLLQYAYQLGIMVINGAEVQSFEEQGTGVHVLVKHNCLPTTLQFKAKQLAICTNAFTTQLLPNIELKPGRGQVLLTNPIPNLLIKGIFHFEQGYYYFRNVGNRILFGGGRQLDFEGESTTTFAANPLILADLKHQLQNIILPQTDFEVEEQWTGIMGFGKDKRPIIQQISPHLFLGVKLGGMGVAVGSMVGEELGKLMVAHL